jgi:DNA-binding CsgD family transcriptional regulator
MAAPSPGRALAAIVLVVAVLNTAAGLSIPVRDRAAAPLALVVSLGLPVSHAAIYWYGTRIRERWGAGGYTGAQGALLFGLALTRVPVPVSLGLLAAATAELIALAGSRWGTVRITIGAVALYTLASVVTLDLYRAASAGLVLALTGMLAHAAAGLVRSAAASRAGAPAVSLPEAVAAAGPGLSSREIEVLRALARGARNREIAGQLGISERTVKSHLGSIYQKLGVQTRSAAVAAAVHRKLV